METLYNKTALKKIKKDDLITMFLDQQAKLYDGIMDDASMAPVEENQKLAQQVRIHKMAVIGADEENKKLKKKMEDIKEKSKPYHWVHWQDIVNEKDDEIKKLGGGWRPEWEIENKDLKEENKDLKEELGAKNIALDIIKQENEVNKKNMFRFMKELKELKEELEELKEENANWEADDNNLTKVMSMVNTQLEEADYDEAWSSVDGIIDIITNILEDINILNDLYDGLKEDITIHPDYQRLVELD